MNDKPTVDQRKARNALRKIKKRQAAKEAEKQKSASEKPTTK